MLGIILNVCFDIAMIKSDIQDNTIKYLSDYSPFVSHNDAFFRIKVTLSPTGVEEM